MIAREVPVQDVLRVVLQSGTQNLEEVVDCDWYEKAGKGVGLCSLYCEE